MFRFLAILQLSATLAFVTSVPTAGQRFQGPAFGQLDHGEIVNTDIYGTVSGYCHVHPTTRDRVLEDSVFGPDVPFVEAELPPLVPAPIEFLALAAPLGSNEVDDPVAPADPPLQHNPSTVLWGFPQNSHSLQGNPEDPNIAAGPLHLMTAANSGVRILAKDGTVMRALRMTGKGTPRELGWFDSVLPDTFFVGEFKLADPKVVYDHFENRWIFLYISLNDGAREGYQLISVSDDGDPLGNWCNYALPAHLNGSVPSNNWSDYPDLGFDQHSVYITGNDVPFGSDYVTYSKIRVLEKAELYRPQCGPITWADLWDFRDPDDSSRRLTTIRAAVAQDPTEVGYFAADSPYSTGTHVTIWELARDLTVGATNVPVAESRTPPTELPQLGTSVRILPRVRRRLLNLVYLDGSLWTTQQVGSAQGTFSRVRYLRLGVTGPVPVLQEDVSFGAQGFHYFFPFVVVDEEGNLVLLFNRTSSSEFVNIRYAGRAANASQLFASVPIKSGEGPHFSMCEADDPGCTPPYTPEPIVNYGDYNGAALDPLDRSRLWLFAAYPLGRTSRPSYWWSECGWFDDLQHYGWVAEMTFDSAFSPLRQAFDLIGDREGFHANDPADAPPQVTQSAALLAVLDSFPGSPADLDEGGLDRSIGFTHQVELPFGADILYATVEVRFRGTNILVHNDVVRVQPTQSSPPDYLPVVALRDLLGFEPQADVVYSVLVDLAQVPVRLSGDPGPGGYWSGGPDEYRDFRKALAGGTLDLIFGDDVSVDYSSLLISYRPPIFADDFESGDTSAWSAST